MRVLLLVSILVIPCFARNLIFYDDVESLMKKYFTKQLSEGESDRLDQMFELFRRDTFLSRSGFEFASQSRLTIDCLICRSAFAAFEQSVGEGQTDEQLTDTITTLCVSLGIENHNVCYGAIKLNMPILVYIIKNTAAPVPVGQIFCGLILQGATNPNVCPFNDERFEWQVELPPPPTDPVVPTNNLDNLKIALITDAHIDPLYEPFGVGNCGEPTCCRIGQKPDLSYRYEATIDESLIDESVVMVDGEPALDLDYADVIRKSRRESRNRFPASREDNAPAGYWGDYRDCDTPIWAYDDLIDRISSTHKDIDMIYYVGDTIDHGVWETSYDLINEMNAYLIDKIRKSFGDNIPVIPAIGNHESQPTNQFAPSSVTEPGLDTHWLYEALVNKWGIYLDEGARESLRIRGGFSMLVKPGLRVISLNNNVAYTSNWWLVYDPTDAKRHLDWLIEELHIAELAGERVHILAHIPPGVPDLTKIWTREYKRIINRFSSIIKAEFNGHTHSDEFKIFYSSDDGSPLTVAWNSGGATAYSHYNLNYKLVTFDTDTYEPTDIDTYIYNLTEANLTPQRRPHWFRLYNFRTNFGVNSLSAATLDDLVHRMVTTDRNRLELYIAYSSKLNIRRWSTCNDNCKLDQICKIVVTELWERGKCEELTSLFNSQ